MAAVSQKRIDIATNFGLANADIIADVCRKAGVPYFVACALFEKESMGRNVYGHDKGGALSGFPHTVNYQNWLVFRWLVLRQGQTSNGVGPSQITWPGFFTDMERKGLRPWVVHDNMLYGLQVLKGHHDHYRSWEKAGTAYNGDPAYGADLAKKIGEWKHRFGI